MNRRDLDDMRDRLAARHAAETEDHPAILALGVFLFAVALILFAFL